MQQPIATAHHGDRGGQREVLAAALFEAPARPANVAAVTVPNTDPPDPAGLFALIGEQGFTDLVAAFYAQVPGDDILGPMYPPHDMAGAERRLREFLIYRCGGPPRYIQERGHPRLRMRHGPFAIDQRARDRWLQLMTNAMDQVALAGEARARLHAFVADVATFLINR